MRLIRALSVAFLLLLAPSRLRAQSPENCPPVLGWMGESIEFAWADCGGPRRQDFGCGENSGTFPLVITYRPDRQIEGFVGVEFELGFVFDIPFAPDWWRLEQGGCRAGALQGAPTMGLSCEVPYDGLTDTNVSYTLTGSSRMPARAHVDFGRYEPTTLEAGSEYSTPLRLSKSRTTGNPSCDGCGTGVCITLNELILYTTEGPIYLINQWQLFPPHVSFQADAFMSDCGCSVNLGRVVCPVEQRSWGALKRIYQSTLAGSRVTP